MTSLPFLPNSYSWPSSKQFSFYRRWNQQVTLALWNEKNNDKSYMTNEVPEKIRVLFTTVPCAEVDSIYCSPRNRYCRSCSKVLILPITGDNIVYFWLVTLFLKLVSWLLNKKVFHAYTVQTCQFKNEVCFISFSKNRIIITV